MDAPATLTLAAIGASLLDVPNIPVISADPAIIAVVDVIRVGLLVAGLSLAGLTVHHAWTVPEFVPEGALVAYFRRRCAALVIGLVYVCTAAYDRINEPVTVQFVLSLLFVLAALFSVHDVTHTPRSAPVHEQDVRNLPDHGNDNGPGPGAAPGPRSP